MNINLKRLLPLLLIAGYGMNASAQGCGVAGRVFGNTALGSFGPYTGLVDGTDIILRTWEYTLGSVNNNGTCSTATQFPTLSGNHGVNVSWTLACMTGCSTAAQGRQVALVSNRTGEGTTGHAGQYVILSVGWSAANTKWNADLVTNGSAAGPGTCPAAAPNCHVTPQNFPVLNVQTLGGAATYNHATGTGNVVVSFTQPAVNGFYDVAPATPIITGYKIYQLNGNTAPTTSNLASWGTALTQATPITCSAGTCSGVVTVNTIASSVNGCPASPTACSGWLALSLMTEGGFETQFVSANSAPIGGPLAVEGLPTSIEAYNTKVGNLPGVQVRWTVTDDSTIAGYNVLASRDGSSFVKVNDREIAPVGAGTYTQNITRRTLASKLGGAKAYLLKVQVILKDGTTQDVGPASYSFK